MTNCKSLQHTKWECKYHVVFIPKYRRKVLYGQLREPLGRGVPTVALQETVLVMLKKGAGSQCVLAHSAA